ncbi:MAG: putative Ig domain-containing protein [Povalibacter sp.]
MFISSRTLAVSVHASVLALCLLPQFAGAATNLPPVISGTPATTATVGTTYTFKPTAKDPEGKYVSFGIRSLPTWATFDRVTGTLKGTPTATGTASNVQIYAWDGEKAGELPAFSITVKAATTTPTTTTTTATNTAPTLTGTPATSVTLGNSYSFTPTAKDAEGNTLGFSITNRPSWATFSTSTGQLSGKPTATGTFASIVISVSDGTATTKLPAFSIAVKAAPVASSSNKGGVTLSWTPPTANTDGSSMNTLSGYRIYYGTAAGVLVKTIQVNNPSISSYVIQDMSAATYYFAVRAVTTSGKESALSNVTSMKVL